MRPLIKARQGSKTAIQCTLKLINRIGQGGTKDKLFPN